MPNKLKSIDAKHMASIYKKLKANGNNKKAALVKKELVKKFKTEAAATTINQFLRDFGRETKKKQHTFVNKRPIKQVLGPNFIKVLRKQLNFKIRPEIEAKLHNLNTPLARRLVAILGLAGLMTPIGVYLLSQNGFSTKEADQFLEDNMEAIINSSRKLMQRGLEAALAVPTAIMSILHSGKFSAPIPSDIESMIDEDFGETPDFTSDLDYGDSDDDLSDMESKDIVIKEDRRSMAPKPATKPLIKVEKTELTPVGTKTVTTKISPRRTNEYGIRNFEDIYQ